MLFTTAVIGIGFWVLPGVASYVMFHPYADTLKGQLLWSATGFPVLYAILGTAMLGQPFAMVPINFLRVAIPILIVVPLLHYAERRVRTR